MVCGEDVVRTIAQHTVHRDCALFIMALALATVKLAFMEHSAMSHVLETVIYKARCFRLMSNHTLTFLWMDFAKPNNVLPLTVHSWTY